MGSNKQSVRHFNIARGSCAELLTQIIIAHEIGLINDSETKVLIDKCEHISIMLLKLIIARKKKD